MPRYIATGKMYGRNGYRGQFYFKDGVCTVTDAQTEDGMRIRHIAEKLLPRDYAAYPENVAEEIHQKWLAKQGKKDGKQLAVDTNQERGPAESLASRAASTGGNNAGSGAGPGRDSTDGGAGDQSGTGVHDGAPGTQVEQIQNALKKVNPDDDSAWTQRGLPKLEAIIGELDFDVTRDQIDQAFPGFDRNIAKKIKE